MVLVVSFSTGTVKPKPWYSICTVNPQIATANKRSRHLLEAVAYVMQLCTVYLHALQPHLILHRLSMLSSGLKLWHIRYLLAEDICIEQGMSRLYCCCSCLMLSSIQCSAGAVSSLCVNLLYCICFDVT